MGIPRTRRRYLRNLPQLSAETVACVEYVTSYGSAIKDNHSQLTGFGTLIANRGLPPEMLGA